MLELAIIAAMLLGTTPLVLLAVKLTHSFLNACQTWGEWEERYRRRREEKAREPSPEVLHKIAHVRAVAAAAWGKEADRRRNL